MCSNSFRNPHTLSCLHTFCLACLQTQKPISEATPSNFFCHLCGLPYTFPSPGGLNAFECNAFIDSLVKSAKDNMGDVNRVILCDGCGEEDATVYCVDCQENFGPTCLVPHRRGKLSASHQQIPLDEAMACDTAIKRIPRCQKHVGYEVDSYCKNALKPFVPSVASKSTRATPSAP